MLDASLGYFNHAARQRAAGLHRAARAPRPAQWAALALATAGVLWLTVQVGQLPWIALVLAASFGCYGLMRKVAVSRRDRGPDARDAGAGTGAALITLAWWLAHGTGAMPAADAKTNLMLVLIGPLTAIPLLLFAAGARRISMTTLGLLQYLGPTIQFLLGVWLFKEPFDTVRAIGFGFIWAGLAAYTWDGWRSTRRRSAAA